MLAACAGLPRSVPPRPEAGAAPAPTGAPKIGRPYRIAGVWYYPAEDNDYDEAGLASWYGPKFHGRPTANGERFDMNQLTAAHRTLPLPSTVLVTNLENGRSIKVRVNDRGPFVDNRIIDLSRRAAQFLGFEKQGVARVRVQLVRADGSVADRSRRVAAVRAQGPVAGPFFVQLISLSDFSRAREVYRTVRPLGRAEIQTADVEGRTVYRVRLGPYSKRGLAEDALDRAYDAGFKQARLFTDRVS